MLTKLYLWKSNISNCCTLCRKPLHKYNFIVFNNFNILIFNNFYILIILETIFIMNIPNINVYVYNNN